MWVVFWGMFRHSPLIRRVQRESYRGYVRLLHGMLEQLLPRAAPAGRRRARRARVSPLDLRFAAIGLTALLDGLWLEWCLEPGAFQPAEAVRLCEAWVGSLRRRVAG